MVASLLDSIGTYAILLAEAGRPQASTLMWGAYEAGAREIGYDVDQPDELAVRQAAVSELRAALGREAFTEAWNRGASMSPAQAVALARREGEDCSRPGEKLG